MGLEINRRSNLYEKYVDDSAGKQLAVILFFIAPFLILIAPILSLFVPDIFWGVFYTICLSIIIKIEYKTIKKYYNASFFKTLFLMNFQEVLAYKSGMMQSFNPFFLAEVISFCTLIAIYGIPWMIHIVMIYTVLIFTKLIADKILSRNQKDIAVEFFTKKAKKVTYENN